MREMAAKVAPAAEAAMAVAVTELAVMAAASLVLAGSSGRVVARVDPAATGGSASAPTA